MVESTPFLPGLSPVSGKRVVARLDGGEMSSDGGELLLREVEQGLGLADRLTGCLEDARHPGRVRRGWAAGLGGRAGRQGWAAILRFRMLMIAAGYEDGIDASALRADPVFELALERLPGERDLCSQSTISRLENLPDRRMLLKMARSMVGLYCASFAQVPKRITLDIPGTWDDTFDAVHGGQQLRLFNAHYDDYGFQPIVVFDGAGRFVLPCRARPSVRKVARSPPICGG